MARRACDGDGPARRLPGGRRQPRGPRRRDQRAQRVPGPRRRHGLEHARHRPGRARRGRGASPASRPTGSPRRSASARSWARAATPASSRSQIFRGMAEGLGGKSRFNGLDLAHALREGAEDRLRRGREAGRGDDPDRHPRGGGGGGRRRRARRRYRDASSARPSTRPRSRSRGRRRCCRSCARPASSTRAGRACTGCSRARCCTSSGEAPAGGRARPVARATGAKASTLVAHADEGFGYETMFLLQPAGPAILDVDAIRDAPRGDRRVGPRRRRRAGRSRSTSTTSGPTRSSATGWRSGTLSRISVENLDNQARDVRETRAAAFTTGRRSGTCDGAAAGRRAAASATDGARDRWSSRSPPATGSRRSSATSASPRSSTAASRPTRAPASCSRRSRPSTPDEVLLLPNNPNVVLAARQVAAMADRPVAVVADAQRRRGLRRAPRARPEPRRGRNAAEMTEAGRGDPDARRHRGRPRRDDRRAQGQAAARRSRSTPTTASSPSTATATKARPRRDRGAAARASSS